MRTLQTAKVADEVWIAVALLHREHPERDAFSPSEILQRVVRENMVGTLRPGVAIHINQHSVANRVPNTPGGRYRMLFETPDKRRRLFRPGDPYHPYREGYTKGYKTQPDPQDIPERYHYLLEWYEQEYCAPGVSPSRPLEKGHPLLQLIGAGASGRSDVAERHDDYVTGAAGDEGR